MLEWSDLLYFLAVHREGTLSGAARSLQVAQTTVGRRLKALETELNAKLFRRTKSGLQLTQVGTTVLDAALAMETSAQAVQRRASNNLDRMEGKVRVSTTESFARTHVVPRLAALGERYPALSFEIVATNRALDLEALDTDLAVRLMRPTVPTLIGRKIADIELALFASRAYVHRHGAPKLGESFAGHRVIGYVEELSRSAEARWLSEHASEATMPLRTNSIPATVAAVASGMGVGLLPVQLAAECEQLECLAAVAELPRRPVWVVFHRDHQRDARIRAVVDCLTAAASP